MDEEVNGYRVQTVTSSGPKAAGYFNSATAAQARERATRLAAIQSKYETWMVREVYTHVGQISARCGVLEGECEVVRWAFPLRVVSSMVSPESS